MAGSATDGTPAPGALPAPAPVIPGRGVVAAGTAAAGLGWAVAALLSSAPAPDALALTAFQAALAFLSLALLARALRTSPECGPGPIALFALHVLVYYGITNVTPALFPESRSLFLQEIAKIPVAPTSAYAWGTASAILLLLGVAIGGSLAEPLLARLGLRRAAEGAHGVGAARLAWLPGYRVSMWSCAALLALLGAGTARFGLAWSTVMDDATVASLSIPDQLVFHGLFSFAPVVPLFAGVALVRAPDPARRRAARALLVGSSLIVVALLMVWRMRTAAICALVLPMGLAVHVGHVSWRRLAVPAAVLVAVAYGVVTWVRVSDLPNVILAAGGTEDLSAGEIAAALARPGDSEVTSSAAMDLSYRASGLEGVAAILDAQGDGRVSPQLGRTALYGFLQTLPAALRSEQETDLRIKNAPAHYNLFVPGDWVTTVLAEAVFDFGPVFALLPGLALGALLVLVDAVLLALAERRRWRGLLSVRLAWLVAVFFFEFGIADRLVMFFKATAGYVAVLLLLGALVREDGQAEA